MLHFIIGRVGSGKTYMARKILIEEARKAHDGKLLLIVPEQYSFESERAVLSGLEIFAAERVEVLSFTRLVDIVQRRYGGMAGRSLDNSGRAALMSLALSDVKSRLTVFEKQAEYQEFIPELLRLSTEFKRLSLSENDLHNVYTGIEDGLLKNKLEELKLIFSAYDSYVARSYLDSEECLDRLYNIVKEKQYFSKSRIFIDSFSGFTGQQYKILEEMISQADDVYITLCTDSIAPGENSIFGSAGKIVNRLAGYARENGCKVAAPIKLTEQRRFATESMKVLESSLFADDAISFDEAEGITLRQADNIYDECDCVASEINRLVREKGLRYKDIAIIARDLDNYGRILPSALRRHGIPCFYDSKTSASSLPLFMAVRSVLKIIARKFRSEDVFAYLKSGLAGYCVSDVSRLEKYTLIWGITGKQWQSEWTGSPRGFEAPAADYAEELTHLNDMRKRLAEDIESLFNHFRSGSSRDMAEGIYTFLKKTKADKHLQELCDDSTSELYERSWEVLMHILDQMAELFAEKNLTPENLLSVFEIMTKNSELGEIPQHMDECVISEAERARIDGARAVFVMGVNDGIFPKRGAEGILTAADRRKISQIGVDISRPDDEENDERLLFYNTLCTASEYVFITYPLHNLSGGELVGSEYIEYVEDIFPSCRCTDEMIMPDSEGEVLRMAAERYHEEDVFAVSLREYLRRFDEEGSARLGMAASRQSDILCGSTAGRLFGKNLMLSASKVETYSKCAFSYFCRYGMGAKPLQKAEIDSLRRGTIMHYGLEQMLRRYGGNLSDLPISRIKDETMALLMEYMIDLTGTAKLTSLLDFILDRISTTLSHVLLHISGELLQSRFTPAAYELSVKKGGDVPPLEIPLADGGKICVTGFIDRVDKFSEKGRTYIRIIDYKTGRRVFDLSDVLYGQNMQMLIYLFTLCENGAETLGENLVPAGILYMPVKRASVKAAKGEDIGLIEAKYDKQLRMNGLLLNDADVIEAMETSGSGKFIPAYLNKDGSLSKRSSAISQSGLELLEEYVKEKLRDMGLRLHSGDISINPCDGTGSLACAYCDYRSVCRIDASFDIKKVEKAGMEEITKTMDEVLKNGVFPH